MGMKRNEIDIGKKIAFYFSQNVWKYTVFSHLHLKYEKSDIMTQKKIFLKNINLGIQNAEFYAVFKFVDANLKNAPRKS